ncbi:MAG: hypothetical protein ACYDCN_10545 [Bacteroidia bacterium]
MKVDQFIELMNNPGLLEDAHIPDIEKIITDYPYFQTAHLLYAKTLNNVKHINYHSALKRTAIIAGNRAVLYRLINSPIDHPKKKTIVENTAPIEGPLTGSIKQVPISKEADKPETKVSPVNITYTIVSEQKPVEQIALNEEQQLTKDNLRETENRLQTETLDEIILEPVVAAYVETEILKITEKEPEITIEKPRSFIDWLKQMPVISKEIVVTSQPKEQTPKLKNQKQDLLDKLLKEEMRISKPQPDKNFYAASQKTRSSVLEDENLVTETLAKIYVLQGNHGKAIRAYEILSLKYPEKSVYFAALIKELKNNIK